jgi:hypothetical protein
MESYSDLASLTLVASECINNLSCPLVLLPVDG